MKKRTHPIEKIILFPDNDKSFKLLQPISRFLRSVPVILTFAVVMLFYASSVIFYYQKYVGAYHRTNLASIIFLDAYTSVMFFIIPLLACKSIFKERLADIGLRKPENKKITLWLILLAYSVVVPITIFCAQQSQFKMYYSFSDTSVVNFIFIHLLLLPIYYFSEEFFFRGFLFLTLWRKVGWHSFWITDIFFTVAHFGKPGYEIILSIPASILLNYLTLKTKSIYPALLVHATIGIVMNTVVYYSCFFG